MHPLTLEIIMTDIIESPKPARRSLMNELRLSVVEEQRLRTESYDSLYSAMSNIRNDVSDMSALYNNLSHHLDDVKARLNRIERIAAVHLTDDPERPVHLATWRKLVDELKVGVVDGVSATATKIKETFGGDAAKHFVQRVKNAARAAQHAMQE